MEDPAAYGSILAPVYARRVCATCRWWERDRRQPLKPCLHKLLAVDAWSANRGLAPIDYPNCAGVDAWDADPVAFVTGPEFGCCHWEAV